MTLDTMDRRLLGVLQKRGRISNADLAEAVNLSPSACHRRVQRLETEGYIKGYVALWIRAAWACPPPSLSRSR